MEKVLHLRQPIHYYPDCVEPFQLWKPYHNVHGDTLPWSIGNWPQAKNSYHGMSLTAGLLAAIAIPYEPITIHGHLLPIMLSVKEIESFHPSLMSRQP
jgi:hypothetical protein